MTEDASRHLNSKWVESQLRARVNILSESEHLKSEGLAHKYYLYMH